MKKSISYALVFALVVGLGTFGMISASDAGKKEYKKDKDLLSLYKLTGEAGFNTLAKAIDAAGLDETLSTGGPYTVFAPTDEAFAALPEGTLESLLKDKEALRNVLLYHVTEGKVMAKDVVGLSSAKMMNGEEVSINTKDGVKVNSSNVVKTDVLAKNGVVHVIDAVLVP